MCVTFFSGIHVTYDTILDTNKCLLLSSALVGSLAMVGMGIFSTLVAKVYNRIGPRATVILGVVLCSGALLATSQGNSIYSILITYGVMFGFGSSFIFLTPYLVLPRYFVKRLSLAVGLVAMGPGGGMFVMSVVMKALLDELDWRRTYMILAGFVSLSVPLVCTVRSMPPEEEESKSVKKDAKERFCESVWSLFSNKRFDIIFLSMNLYYVVHYIPSVHMVSLRVEKMDHFHFDITESCLINKSVYDRIFLFT